jgi:hypothetical protein
MSDVAGSGPRTRPSAELDLVDGKHQLFDLFRVPLLLLPRARRAPRRPQGDRRAPGRGSAVAAGDDHPLAAPVGTCDDDCAAWVSHEGDELPARRPNRSGHAGWCCRCGKDAFAAPICSYDDQVCLGYPPIEQRALVEG